jgi:hypothetical protein
MSSTVLKLIPTDMRHVPSTETHQKALEVLVELTRGWEPEATAFGRLEYIDPGEDIEAIICPRCQARLEMDWALEDSKHSEWYSDIVEQEQACGPDSLQVVTPCCQQTVRFTELQFVDAGFAMFELTVLDPGIDYPMSAEMLSNVEAALGCPLKQVWAHY